MAEACAARPSASARARAGSDAFLLESLFRNDAWGHMLKPVSEANERAVYQSMADGCRGALQVPGAPLPCTAWAVRRPARGPRTGRTSTIF